MIYKSFYLRLVVLSRNIVLLILNYVCVPIVTWAQPRFNIYVQNKMKIKHDTFKFDRLFGLFSQIYFSTCKSLYSNIFMYFFPFLIRTPRKKNGYIFSCTPWRQNYKYGPDERRPSKTVPALRGRRAVRSYRAHDFAGPCMKCTDLLHI